MAFTFTVTSFPSLSSFAACGVLATAGTNCDATPRAARLSGQSPRTHGPDGPLHHTRGADLHRTSLRDKMIADEISGRPKASAPDRARDDEESS
jgi:hypothetical protein